MKAPWLALLLLALPARGRASSAGDFLSALREVLFEDHVDVRDPSWILERSGFKPEAVAAELARLLPDMDDRQAVEAADILGRLGPRAAAAAPALKRLESARDPDARYCAARALRRIAAHQ